ncbi:hypothetical protein NDU88_003841 [Pleurodeles waltl]|uniref:Uncharacterized protein n=1 Tax=Pleurodeles waltl TaxID=8319 RepID=A0AAV7W836_PLEWA|nr:hypothetical protein NDU88_003841 [Pleurodeles waltl]
MGRVRMPLFPGKKRRTGALWCETCRRLAESQTCGGPPWRTGAAPGNGRLETKAQSGGERWGGSRAPRRPAAPVESLRCREMGCGEEARRAMRGCTGGASALE